MNVVVMGLGYIGLPTAAMLATAGHRVIGFDVNARLIDDIRAGCGHVNELEVRQLSCAALAAGTLTVTTQFPPSAQAYIICVPTPTAAHKPDLHYVEACAAMVAEQVSPGDLIVLESTVPPGTVEHVIVRALESRGVCAEDVHIAHCPERVIPGSIVHELRSNPRVIGGRRPEDARAAQDLYASFCEGEICLTDCTTAELVKVVENTFRDVNLAFANELALLAEALDVDVWEVIRLANKHPRVNVLRPGPGVGGHCIPVDPHFLSNANPFVTELIQTARRVNERMPHVVSRLIDEMIAPIRSGANIAVLGAAYKADIDDTRESPAREVVSLLHERGHRTSIYDPFARAFEYDLVPTLEAAVADADALVLLTDHQLFREIDPLTIAPLVRQRVLIDTRNHLDRDVWTAAGFCVRTLGAARIETSLQTTRSA